MRACVLASTLLIGLAASMAVAQEAAPAAPVVPAAPALAAPTALQLIVGRSAIVNTPAPIARVALTSAAVADALVTSPQQLIVHGKTPGTISMMVWDRAGAIQTYEVAVVRDIAPLSERLTTLFPDEPITAAGSGDSIVLSGIVSSQYVADKSMEVASGYSPKVVNLMRLQEAVNPVQIMLQVRFAEVQRNTLSDLGASFFSIRGKYDWDARTTTEQFPVPNFEDRNGREVLTFSDFLNIFLFNAKQGIGGLIKALQSRGLFQTLAEPNLVAQNGKEASFLAGGEYPYPAVQGSGAVLSVTIQFKEFGVRLNFTPTVVGGDLIHLRVRPEVSSLDFSNAVTLQGFRVPALLTRRAETEVELHDGQTFAMAGLLNNSVARTLQKVPGIGDIPILGKLFQSRELSKNRTELVVLITPHILKEGSAGAASGLPRLVEPFLGPSDRTLPPPPAQLPGAPPPAVKPPDAAAMAAVTPKEPARVESTNLKREREELKRAQAQQKKEQEQLKAAQQQLKKDQEKLAAAQDEVRKAQAKRDVEAARKAAEEAKKKADADKKKAADEAKKKPTNDEGLP